jgi:acyl-CoA synthetase (AMP-forming)/AMP-acid ligase II
VKMLETAPLDWLSEPPAERGLSFAGPGQTWDHWSYASLARLTLRTATALAQRGVRRDDVVAIVQRSGPSFPATLFGALAAGATPCCVPPPFVYQNQGEYATHVSHLIASARPALVVADSDAAEQLVPVTRSLGLPGPVCFGELVEGAEPMAEPAPSPRYALLQFTSGSSGYSRGVLVTNAALRANLAAIQRWLDWTPDCSGVTWLPMHHDMGLVGCLINAVTTCSPGWIMQPGDFIRSPLRYLTALSENRAQMTAIPNFGLVHILRRIKPAQLEELRFDALRVVVLGAERIDPAVLEGVEKLLGPYGFDWRALVPAYGGAEATLAVTGLRPGTGWIAKVPPDGTSQVPVVGCGQPLGSATVTVVDDAWRPVPEGVVGEITVTGSSVAAGYSGDPGTASGTSIENGTLRTGDAGFMSEGQLFVLGRLGDGLKLNGKMVFAENLEARLRERGVPERRAAVLLGVRDGRPTGVAVLDKGEPGWASTALEILRAELSGAEVLVLNLPRGGLQVTSSGKPRRRVMWRSFCADALTVRHALGAQA